MEYMLKEISDPETVKHLDSIAAATIEETYLIRMDWLSKKGRTAVVVESAMHLNDDYSRNFSEAMKASGHDVCYAVATEELEGVVRHWEVPATPDGLLKFSEETAMYNFVLFPGDGSFAILCTVDDYIIVAGERVFVEKACGGSIDAARAAFRKFIFDDRHREIADRYEKVPE